MRIFAGARKPVRQTAVRRSLRLLEGVMFADFTQNMRWGQKPRAPDCGPPQSTAAGGRDFR